MFFSTWKLMCNNESLDVVSTVVFEFSKSLSCAFFGHTQSALSGRRPPLVLLSSFLDFLFCGQCLRLMIQLCWVFFGYTQSALFGRSPTLDLCQSLLTLVFWESCWPIEHIVICFYRFYDVCIVCDIDFLISHFKTFC